MAKWHFDNQQYQEDKFAFLNGIQAMTEKFFGEENKLDIATLADNKENSEIKKTPLELVLEALPEVVTNGRWDSGTLPDADEVIEFYLDACIHLSSTEYCASFYTQYGMDANCELSKDFSYSLEVFRARCYLECGYDLSIYDLALLANMDSRSVANALRIEYGNSIDTLDASEAKLWLAQKRGFKPTQYFNSRIDTQQLNEVKHLGEFFELVHFQAEKQNISPETLSEVTQGLYVTDRFHYLKNEDLLDRPELLAKLAETLNWNPSWFVKRVLELKAKYEIDLIELEKKESIEKTVESLGLSLAFSKNSSPIEPAELATSETVRTLINNTPGYWRHPKDKGNNAKIDAYRATNHRVIAHEHNLKQQHLWASSEGLHFSHIKIKWSESRPPHHSGIAKYPELNAVNLIRFDVDSIEQVKQVLETVTKALPIGFILSEHEEEEKWH